MMSSERHKNDFVFIGSIGQCLQRAGNKLGTSHISWMLQLVQCLWNIVRFLPKLPLTILAPTMDNVAPGLSRMSV